MLAAPAAFARAHTYSGTICQPVPASVSCIEYSQFGVNNTCSTTQTVECPLPIDYSNAATTIFNVYVVAYDRSTTSNVSCTLQKTNTDGLWTYSANATTFNGGANSSSQFINFFPNVSVDGFWHVRCTLPGVQTAGQFSHITNLLFGTND